MGRYFILLVKANIAEAVSSDDSVLFRSALYPLVAYNISARDVMTYLVLHRFHSRSAGAAVPYECIGMLLTTQSFKKIRMSDGFVPFEAMVREIIGRVDWPPHRDDALRNSMGFENIRTLYDRSLFYYSLVVEGGMGRTARAEFERGPYSSLPLPVDAPRPDTGREPVDRRSRATTFGRRSVDEQRRDDTRDPERRRPNFNDGRVDLARDPAPRRPAYDYRGRGGRGGRGGGYTHTRGGGADYVRGQQGSYNGGSGGFRGNGRGSGIQRGGESRRGGRGGYRGGLNMSWHASGGDGNAVRMGGEHVERFMQMCADFEQAEKKRRLNIKKSAELFMAANPGIQLPRALFGYDDDEDSASEAQTAAPAVQLPVLNVPPSPRNNHEDDAEWDAAFPDPGRASVAIPSWLQPKPAAPGPSSGAAPGPSAVYWTASSADAGTVICITDDEGGVRRTVVSSSSVTAAHDQAAPCAEPEQTPAVEPVAVVEDASGGPAHDAENVPVPASVKN